MASTLDDWLEAEAGQQFRFARSPGAGVTAADVAARLSGLELMQAMLDGRLPYPVIGQTMDFLLIDVAHGRAVFQGTPGGRFFTRWAPCTAVGTPRCWIQHSAVACTRRCRRARATRRWS